MRTALPIAIAIVSSLPSAVYPAAPPAPAEPWKAILSSGHALALARRDGVVHVWSQQMRPGGSPLGVECSTVTSQMPLRWHAAGGAVWIVNSMDTHIGRYRPDLESLFWYELAPLLRGHRVIGPGCKPSEDSLSLGITGVEPVKDKRFFASLGTTFEPFIEYDILPLSANSTLLFRLSNVKGEFINRETTDLLVSREYKWNEEPQRSPNWTFACFSTSSRWVAGKEDWEEKGWKEEFTLNVRFREPFQALSKGNDYYFLTASGKLYRSPKPAKEKHRTVELVYGDPTRPVRAFVTDADAGRTFLFVGPDKDGGKHAFFELAERPKLVPHDPPRLAAGEAPIQLRKVLAYAAVIREHGLVKIK